MKSPKEQYDDVAAFLGEVKAAAIEDPGLTCAEIVDVQGDALEEMSLDELENFMLRVASYNTYLKSQKSSLDAQLIILRAELTNAMALRTYNHKEQFVSNDEKRAIVLGNSSELASLHDKIIAIEAKIAKLAPIPFAIDKKMDLIRLKYVRRCNESTRSSA